MCLSSFLSHSIAVQLKGEKLGQGDQHTLWYIVKCLINIYFFPCYFIQYPKIINNNLLYQVVC